MNSEVAVISLATSELSISGRLERQLSLSRSQFILRKVGKGQMVPREPIFQQSLREIPSSPLSDRPAYVYLRKHQHPVFRV